MLIFRTRRYTPQGIVLGGPAEFGYDDLDFIPLGTPYVSLIALDDPAY